MNNTEQEFCDNCNNKVCCCTKKQSEQNKPGIDTGTVIVNGVKWSQKKTYSEEDMVEFAFDTYCYISGIMKVPFNQVSENKLHVIDNLEQFKNR